MSAFATLTAVRFSPAYSRYLRCCGPAAVPLLADIIQDLTMVSVRTVCMTLKG
jgi:hypothetical protein